MSNVIRVHELSKAFRVPVRAAPGGGPLTRLKRFVVNPSEELLAVRELSFAINPGEVVGFLGANGSGKSTTIKMLTGILTPTSGEISVLGFNPHRERTAYTHHIGVVLGQKSLLWWNIPVVESFKLYRDIFGQSREAFERRLDRFSELLEIREFLHVPVRKLSLGLRMRAEIVASLLHRPQIIFLDEPTIGLDVLARRNLKRFLKRINQEEGITIFLTTHNMFDVEDLCRRCLLIEQGRLVYDGDIATLKANEQHKVVELEILETLDRRRLEAAVGRCQVLAEGASSYRLQVPTGAAVEIIDELLASCRPANLNVLPPTLESVVERIFEQRQGEPRGAVHVA